MAEPVDRIAAPIPHRRMRRVRREGRGARDNSAFHTLISGRMLNGKASVDATLTWLHRRLGHQISVERLKVFFASPW